MSTHVKCGKCGSTDLMYREIWREPPTWVRVLYIAVPSLMVVVAIINIIQGTAGFFIPMFILFVGGVGIYLLITGQMKEFLTSIRFKCNECENEWDVENTKMGYAKKWQEVYQRKWQTYRPGMDLPEF